MAFDQDSVTELDLSFINIVIHIYIYIYIPNCKLKITFSVLKRKNIAFDDLFLS